MLNLAVNHENKFYYLVLINCPDFSFALLIKTVVETVKNFLETSMSMSVSLGVPIWDNFYSPRHYCMSPNDKELQILMMLGAVP